MTSGPVPRWQQSHLNVEPARSQPAQDSVASCDCEEFSWQLCRRLRQTCLQSEGRGVGFCRRKQGRDPEPDSAVDLLHTGVERLLGAAAHSSCPSQGYRVSHGCCCSGVTVVALTCCLTVEMSDLLHGNFVVIRGSREMTDRHLPMLRLPRTVRPESDRFCARLDSMCHNGSILLRHD